MISELGHTTGRMSDREITLDFIATYESYPCLWNIYDPGYNKKSVKNNAYMVLLGKFLVLKPDATLDCVKKKIEYMRASYRREHRKVLQSWKTTPDDVYVPTLWYYSAMKFLTMNDPVEFEFQNDGTNPIVSENDDSYAANDSPPSSYKRRKPNSRIKQEPLELFISKEEDSELASFTKVIAMQMMELKESQRHVAQKLFSDIIFYGRLEKLTPDSSITFLNDATRPTS